MGLMNRIVRYFGLYTESMLREQLDEQESLFEMQLDEQNEFSMCLYERLCEADKEIGRANQEIRDGEDIVNILYKDKEEAEGGLNDLQLLFDNQGILVRDFDELSDREKRVLLSYVPRGRSSKHPQFKIKDRKSHTDPNGYGTFLDRLSRCVYVEGIWGLRHNRKNAKKTSFNKIYREDGKWNIEGEYVGDFGKFFRMITTARNEREARFVMDLLNNQF